LESAAGHTHTSPRALSSLAGSVVKAKEGQAFVDWLISKEGQAAIASYKIDGQQLFFPNAPRGS